MSRFYPNATKQYVDAGVQNLELWSKYNPLCRIDKPIIMGHHHDYNIIYTCKDKNYNDFFKYNISIRDTCIDLIHMNNNDSKDSDVLDISFMQLHNIKKKYQKEDKYIDHLCYCLRRLVDLPNVASGTEKTPYTNIIEKKKYNQKLSSYVHKIQTNYQNTKISAVNDAAKNLINITDHEIIKENQAIWRYR